MTRNREGMDCGEDEDKGRGMNRKRRREDEELEVEWRQRSVRVGSGERTTDQARRERLRPSDPATAEGWGD